MLLIRHAIGSRLFYQTENFDVQQKGNQWILSVSVPEEQAKQIIKFKDELNFFVVGDQEKTWYYSSDSNIEYVNGDNQMLIYADHKTVYPV